MKTGPGSGRVHVTLWGSNSQSIVSIMVATIPRYFNYYHFNQMIGPVALMMCRAPKLHSTSRVGPTEARLLFPSSATGAGAVRRFCYEGAT